MSNRADSFKELAGDGLVRGRDVDFMKSICHSWEQMAKVHCAGRNQKVGLVLRYCIMIRNRFPLHTAGMFAAEWQLPRNIETNYEIPADWAKKIEEYDLTKEQKEKITAKFRSTQDAHLIPCELKLGSKPLEAYLARGYGILLPGDEIFHIATLRGQFGAVDRLPTMFNESDSHAEAVSLKKALLEACMTITRSDGAMDLGKFQQMHRIAFARWQAEADKGLLSVIEQNKKLRDAARERSYDRLYREVKVAVLEDYRRFTASEVHAMSTSDAMLFLREFI
jgi:hypothetical protein